MSAADDAEVIFRPGLEPMLAGDPPDYPCIEIGGVQVYVYVKDGDLRVAVHFDGADPEVWGEDKCIPIKIDLTGGDPYLYEADDAGNEWINGVPA
jgi:hypothetical protein